MCPCHITPSCKYDRWPLAGGFMLHGFLERQSLGNCQGSQTFALVAGCPVAAESFSCLCRNTSCILMQCLPWWTIGSPGVQMACQCCGQLRKSVTYICTSGRCSDVDCLRKYDLINLETMHGVIICRRDGPLVNLAFCVMAQ